MAGDRRIICADWADLGVDPGDSGGPVFIMEPRQHDPVRRDDLGAGRYPLLDQYSAALARRYLQQLPADEGRHGDLLRVLTVSRLTLLVASRTGSIYKSGDQDPTRLSMQAEGRYEVRVEVPGYRIWVQALPRVLDAVTARGTKSEKGDGRCRHDG
jgi:hypothetical protein